MIYAAGILAIIVIVQYIYIRYLIKEINWRDNKKDYFHQKKFFSINKGKRKGE